METREEPLQTQTGLQVMVYEAEDELAKLAFSQSDSDHAVFIHSKDRNFCIIALYVDDLMILSNDLPLLLQKKKELMSTFKMKDLGEIHWFLSLEVTCD